MISPRSPRRAASGAGWTLREEQPARVDGALRQTVALLELIRQEEALLGWLDDCVAQLHAVRRARQTLLDVTDAEVAEAREASDQPVMEASPASTTDGWRTAGPAAPDATRDDRLDAS
ncbi:hypothetical protein [Microlunatus flavus]|uniref:Uncharacterized protein n=1 Tax=Microlunatus flavus TaxID=1036181 RepID=A0A1H9MV90_9ACTN|nr:hypothetical protein [Microlunatus flavus]SER27630.1 hypothetical protein SAMN05421756_11194 [Microlunatus flavus]